jgi:hypothetical protein
MVGTILLMAKKSATGGQKLGGPRKMKTFTGKKYKTRKAYRGQGR